MTEWNGDVLRQTPRRRRSRLRLAPCRIFPREFLTWLGVTSSDLFFAAHRRHRLSRAHPHQRRIVLLNRSSRPSIAPNMLTYQRPSQQSITSRSSVLDTKYFYKSLVLINIKIGRL